MRRILGLTILGVALASAALADQVAVDLDVANSIIWGYPTAGYSHGWEFTVNQTIEVTHLGMVDVGPAGFPPGLNQDGFEIAHPLGIFRLSDGALLTTGTVGPGSGDELIGYARYTPVPHVLLTPGESYVMTMYSATDAYPVVDFVSIWMSTISPAPEINYVVGRYGGPSTELKLPESIHTLPNAFFGPDFLFVPEPSGILLAALAGVLVGRRR
jgi:hypothetical protein